MLDVELDEVPRAPGCYTFSAGGTALYVGKASDLRARLTTHLRDTDPRLVPMVAQADSLDWVVCASEAEALVVEAGRVSRLQPRYNIRLREADPYPYLALVTSPLGVDRFQVWRGPARRGVRRFGPFPQREVSEALRRVAEEVFGLRSCTDGTFRRAQAQNRACILAEMGRCSAPCTGQVDADEHAAAVAATVPVLRGRTEEVRVKVRSMMEEASSQRAFERAGRMRDLDTALARVHELQRVQGLDGRDVDALALSGPGPQRALHHLEVRSGALVGTRALWLEGTGDDADVVARALAQLYGTAGAGSGSPSEVLVPVLPEGDGWDQVLAAHFGRTVRAVVPVRGSRRQLVELAAQNAEATVQRESRRRDADPGRRAAALGSLGEALGIGAPWRVECFDISHTGGREPVAACVVLHDALPQPSQYRTYLVAPGGDDYAAMHEAVTRRYRPLASGKGHRPDLVVIDGGPGQLAAARSALDALGVQLVTVGLAKRLEEVWTGAEVPVVLDHHDEALHVLQRARDEAHRFSRKAHRRRREAAVRTTGTGEASLPDVRGLGPRRRAALLGALGVDGVGSASVDELVGAGLPAKVAGELHAALHPELHPGAGHGDAHGPQGQASD